MEAAGAGGALSTCSSYIGNSSQSCEIRLQFLSYFFDSENHLSFVYYQITEFAQGAVWHRPGPLVTTEIPAVSLTRCRALSV